MRAIEFDSVDRLLRRLPARNPIVAVAILLVALNVAIAALTVGPTGGASGDDGDGDDAGGAIAFAAAPEPLAATPDPLPPPHSVDREAVITPTPATPFISEVAASTSVAANELGRIPVLMYHAFVFNEENTDDWTITFDQFREQLDWLVANDFVMIGLNDYITRDFSVPAGKRPVVLTFDDASAGQFGLMPGPDGGYVVDPDTAVGVLEEYRETHPEFFGPAFFAVLTFNCFGSEADPSTCEEKLVWLAEHGYEIGNHTAGHQDLTSVSPERLKEEILTPIEFFDPIVPAAKNLSDVLVLPFGAYPSEQYIADLLFDGFWHYGEYFVPTLVLEVAGGPARSPYHVEWGTNVTRYNTDPGTFWQWAEMIEADEVPLFVSDGDPSIVTVPDGWESSLHQERIQQDGRTVVVLK